MSQNKKSTSVKYYSINGKSLYEFLLENNYFDKERKQQYPLFRKFMKSKFKCNEYYDGASLSYYKGKLEKHSRKDYYWNVLTRMRINNRYFEECIDEICYNMENYGYTRIVFGLPDKISYREYTKISDKNYFNTFVDKHYPELSDYDRKIAKKACRIFYHVAIKYGETTRKRYLKDKYLLAKTVFNVFKKEYKVIWDKKECVLYTSKMRKRNVFKKDYCDYKSMVDLDAIITPWTVVDFALRTSKCFKNNWSIKYY